MDTWRSVADRKIQEAMERGEFRNLPGQGRPQRLERNPYEPPELRMAHMVLEGAGLSPAWMLERKDLDREVELARERLSHAVAAGEPSASLSHRGGTETTLAKACAEFREHAAELNRRILTYNLRVPAGVFQRPRLDADFEIARLAEAIT